MKQRTSLEQQFAQGSENGSASAEQLTALEKRIADMESTNKAAETEEAVQAARVGGGADLGGGMPGGGQKYSDLTPEERLKMSHEEVDTMLAREGGT